MHRNDYITTSVAILLKVYYYYRGGSCEVDKRFENVSEKRLENSHLKKVVL